MDKLERLDAYLDSAGLEAVWFAEPSSFAWLTGGDNVVSHHAGVGVAAAGYDGSSVTVVTNNIESPRLADEELAGDVRLVEFQWYEQSLAAAVAELSATPAAADFDVPGFEDANATALRQPLTPEDVERYRSLGAETAAAVEEVCAGLAPDDTEREVRGRLLERLASRGIDAPVALVGGGERASRYRHYTAKDEPLGGYALVSVTAYREGLYVSTTRTVAFEPPAWLDERTDAARTVETTALAATVAAARSEGTAADVFAEVQEAYEATGHAEEWRHHHQGGAAGYAGREWKATPTLDEPVEAPMAYAWNPTVQGAKSENTWLVSDDGVECLTPTDWDTVEVEAVGHDLTLAHPAILDRG